MRWHTFGAPLSKSMSVLRGPSVTNHSDRSKSRRTKPSTARAICPEMKCRGRSIHTGFCQYAGSHVAPARNAAAGWALTVAPPPKPGKEAQEEVQRKRKALAGLLQTFEKS